TIPQLPQLFTSVFVFVSQPSVALLALLSAKPVLHVPEQPPAVQVRAAERLREQTRLQPPQLSGAVVVSDSQPLAALASQLAKPALQTKPQLPAVQVAVAFARGGQTMPQPPQLLTSVPVFVSQPLVALPSQLANGATQAKPHVPPVQVGRA